MTRTMLKSKIHRAVVTQADVDYVGSIEIDQNLMEAADLITNEQVHVWNVTNGERFITYVIPGPRDSGRICINGAAARKVAAGDLVIIATFTELQDAEARSFKPSLVFVDKENNIIPHERLVACR